MSFINPLSLRVLAWSKDLTDERMKHSLALLWNANDSNFLETMKVKSKCVSKMKILFFSIPKIKTLWTEGMNG